MTEEEFDKTVAEWLKNYNQDRGWLDWPSSVPAYRQATEDLSDFVIRLRDQNGLPKSDNVKCKIKLSDGLAMVFIPACCLEFTED